MASGALRNYFCDTLLCQLWCGTMVPLHRFCTSVPQCCGYYFTEKHGCHCHHSCKRWQG